MGGSWGLGVGGLRGWGRLGGHGLMGWGEGGRVGPKKVNKKILKSPSNLHAKSFINLSENEKKYKRIPFKMNSL